MAAPRAHCAGSLDRCPNTLLFPRRHLTVAAFLAASLLGSSSATGSIARHVFVKTLVDQSTLIVVGTVENAVSSWRGTRIITRARVRLDEVWHGRPPGSRISVTTLGGVVGGIGQRVDGAALLEPGDQAALFLRHDERGELRLVGMSQGAFFVRPSPGETRVFRRTFGMRLIRNLQGAHAIPSTLPELRRAVEEALDAR